MRDSRSIRAAATGLKERNAYETTSRSSDNSGTFITDRARFVALFVHVFWGIVVGRTIFRIGRDDGVRTADAAIMVARAQRDRLAWFDRHSRDAQPSDGGASRLGRFRRGKLTVPVGGDEAPAGDPGGRVRHQPEQRW